MIEKINKNLNRVVSTLKLLISHYEKKATPRIPFTEIRWSLSCALECVEKQISKKPMISYDERVKENWCSCSVCAFGFGWKRTVHYKYCPDCGQKLDWSNEDM